MSLAQYLGHWTFWSGSASFCIAVRWSGGIWRDFGDMAYSLVLFVGLFFLSKAGVERRAALGAATRLDRSISPFPFFKLTIAALFALLSAFVIVPYAVEGIVWGLPSILFYNLLNDRLDYSIQFFLGLVLLAPMIKDWSHRTNTSEVKQ